MTSPRTVQRLSRILAVLPYVIDNPGTPVEELATRFGYRDTNDLISDLHLVIVTGLPGYGPGDLIDVDILDGEVFVDAADYFAHPLRLTAPEALGLVAAGMTMAKSDQAPAALGSAVAKLAKALGPDVADVVQFDVATPPVLSDIRSAIEDRSPVRFDYVGIANNKRTTRTVEGWAVTFNMGNWYLTGYCHLAEDRRVFRVDRIENLEIVDRAYERPVEDDVHHVGYLPTESDVHVEFVVAPTSRWVAEYYPVETEELADGDLRIRMSVADPVVAARLIIQLGSDVRTVIGSEVVDALDDLRSRILTRYGRAK